ncbi:MAG: zf-HC2 domain-containing protein [Candidatus Eisenbacteria sp.]|nr:zf-HC2 domain-containing protein [Candidatus Eisenbacteria bacterium]
MNCEQWRDIIVDLLAGELDEEQAIQAEQHIAECDACAEEERLLRATLSAAAPPVEGIPSMRLRERVLETFRRHQPEPAAAIAATPSLGGRLRHLLARPLPTYAAASLAVLALLAGLWLAGPGGIVPGSLAPGIDRQTAPGAGFDGGSSSPDPPGWISAPSDTGGAETPRGENLAIHLPRASRTLETRFVSTPSDAIAPRWSITPDSL